MWESVIPQIWEEPGTPGAVLYSVGALSCHQSHQVLNTFLGEAGRSDVGDEGSQKEGDKPSLGGEHSP